MNKLKAYLDEASIAYYSGSPIISDEVFDRLADSIGYARVGAKESGNTVKHYRQMYSLNKHYEGEGIKPLQDYDITTTPKLDGAAISALYIDGKLAQVLTRGDGIEGINITSKFYARKDLLPLEIPSPLTLQITGEIVVPKHVTNARNVAAGSLNLKDEAEFCTRPLSFFAYGVFPHIADTYTKEMSDLAFIGFETVYAKDIHNIYDCDGVVHRINDNDTFESLGYTAKAPRGSYALKERKEAVETKILAVEWGVGKSGKVTPVAILEPVMIGDKCVTRATLNNPGFIESLGLCIGDTVGVILGGEIIPCITHKVDA